MMKMSLFLLFLGFVVNFSAAAKPGSCVGRCGETFTRGHQCKCDFSCLRHNECCHDYDSVCTAAQSCQGRCGELFRRGRVCDCDPECSLYNTCCHDIQLQCGNDATAVLLHQRTFQSSRVSGVSGSRKSVRGRKGSNSESEEWSSSRRPCRQSQCPGGASSLRNPVLGPQFSGRQTSQLQQGVNNVPVGLLPVSPSFSSGGPPAFGSSLPGPGAPSVGTGPAVSPSGSGAVTGKVNVHLVLSHGGAAASGPSPSLNDPAGARPGPGSTLQDVAQALGLSVLEGGSVVPGAGPLSELCSDSPISGLTALSNGTILIFKGELYWSVDPVSRSAGRPQNITETLGIPSPIDTVFTRSNCHANVYIIKGDQYWRLDRNMVMEPDFPKPLAYEFPGLTGGLRAALAAPASSSRAETIFFFRNGDIMQRFTFPSSNTPSCSITPRSTMRRRSARQAEVLLSGEINLKLTLKDFPSPVTSALTTLVPQRSDRYEHYVFTGPLFFSVSISGDLPALLKPDPSFSPLLSPPVTTATSSTNTAATSTNPLRPPNSIQVWLQCP
ncbi:proteoglycan 4a isoform X2 [Sphaeramia orbicularis]|uniref:proteoglycan 4a isoform X2 n=1 Tax=Sphaeramia orbicularis TaxID=375764 RepID=UPI00117D35AE|nr:proteoglycan 4-like isoform X2 [Sphaeramia orbicularis]